MRRALLLVAAASACFFPELALAASGAEGDGHGGGGWQTFWQWSNLLLLVAVLVYFGRKPVSSFLAERRSSISGDLDSADQVLREAEARLAEWSARAAQLDDEVADIKRVARAAAEQESARIVAEARAVAERIRRDATSAVEREAERARLRLRHETAELAVSSAERILVEQVQPGDADRLFDEFVTRIEQPPAPAGRS